MSPVVLFDTLTSKGKTDLWHPRSYLKVRVLVLRSNGIFERYA